VQKEEYEEAAWQYEEDTEIYGHCGGVIPVEFPQQGLFVSTLYHLSHHNVHGRKTNSQLNLLRIKAEKLSFCGKTNKANSQYNASIAAAQSSKFVHEEGLACELAGNHYEHLENSDKALTMFKQAEKCYKAWGSKWKTHEMAEKIRRYERGR
jgi:hypothetical protein